MLRILGTFRLAIACSLWASLFVSTSAMHLSFEPGDILLSLENGPVQWRLPDGTPRGVLVPTVRVTTGDGLTFAMITSRPSPEPGGRTMSQSAIAVPMSSASRDPR